MAKLAMRLMLWHYLPHYLGIITTLGLVHHRLQGLEQIGWISQNSFALQVGVIVVVMCLAVFSAISGIGKGVKILSEINLTLAFCLLLLF